MPKIVCGFPSPELFIVEIYSNNAYTESKFDPSYNAILGG